VLFRSLHKALVLAMWEEERRMVQLTATSVFIHYESESWVKEKEEKANTDTGKL